MGKSTTARRAELFGGLRGRFREALLDAGIATVGGTLGIAAIVALGVVFSNPLLIAPFGSTCMMIFGAPETPFARPRNVLGGHLICTATGLAALEWLGDRAWVAAIAVGVAMGLMKLTRTFHPPAGGDPIVVILSSPAWLFVVVPVLLGCVTLICVAFVFHKLSKRASYPLW